MVSTTLTTIAAGQPTSSSNHRHSSTAIFAASTANNSNYQRASQQQPQQHQQHSSSSTRNNYYHDASTLNGAGNSNNNTKATGIALQSAVGSGLETKDHSSSNPQQHNKRPTATSFYNGKGSSSSNTVTLSPSTETTNKPDLITTTAQTLAHTKSPQNAASTITATITTPSVNLTKSLLSASPPLNDQISLLFPKCRPKQHVSNNSSNHTSSQDSTTNGSDTADEINSTENPQLIEEESLSSIELQTAAAAEDPATTSTTSNYYRTVNIITQSPPPPSTSSVSSESLSSVTPRISTNPFLYPNLSSSTTSNGDTATNNKLNEIDETNFVDNDEELPVPSYQTFYYHTSSVDRREERKQQLTSNNCEMPRKRSSYVSYHHQPQQQQQLPASQHCTQLPAHSSSNVTSVGSHHHQQLQQQLQQHQSLHNGTSITLQRATQPSSQSQNPFIKDNYWETRHTSTPASTVLNSPKYGNNDGDIPAVVLPSSRRAYHQQTYSSHYMPRQQQHHIRVGRSPINHYGEQYETTRRIGDHMLHPQAQQNHQQPDVMPSQQATTRYLYGSKTSIEQHVGEWDHRERRERESRERDREQREQRVGVGVAGSGGGGGIGEQDSIEVERERLRNICDVVPQQKQQLKQQKPISDGRLSVISDGEIVVFDDIAESWQNLRVTTDPSVSPTTSTTAPLQASTAQLQTAIAVPGSKDERMQQQQNNSAEHDAKTSYKEHRRYIDKNYAITVETRHGIIEYEGSPRRFGQGGGFSTPEDETAHADIQQATKNSNYSTASVASNSPQQYPARPGFPQRVLSPPRESTSPLLLQNNQISACKPQLPPNQQQHQQQYQYLQQQHQQQQQPSPVDNNAEDTSNDVSEIGTLSDMTTPDVTSTAATPANADNIVAVGATTLNAPSVANKCSNNAAASFSLPAKSSTFDYLYEFSETRKVLEEFFKCPSNDEKPIENGSDVDSIDIQYEFQSNLEREDDVDDEEADVDTQEDDEDEQLQQQLQLQLMQQQQEQQQQQQQFNQQNHNNYNISHQRRHFTSSPLMRDFDFFLDSASRSSGEQIDQQDGINHNQLDARNNYRYSPETTDYDSNCGDLDSLSGELNGGVSTSCSNYAKYYASSMPVLEDGLSSGHTSDTENNNINNNLQQLNAIQHAPIGGGISMLMDMKRMSTSNSINSIANTATTIATDTNSVEVNSTATKHNSISPNVLHDSFLRRTESPLNGLLEDSERDSVHLKRDVCEPHDRELLGQSPSNNSNNKVFKNIDPDLDSLYSISVFQRPDMAQMTPPPPAPAPHRKPNTLNAEPEILQPIPYKDMRSSTNITSSATTATSSVASAISSTLNRTKATQSSSNSQPQAARPNTQQQPPPIPDRSTTQPASPVMNSPVWVPRHLENSVSKSLLESSSENHSKNMSADEDEVDTDLETDRLLGHQRLDDQGYYDENKSWDRKSRSLLSKISPKQQHTNTKTRNGYNALLSTTPENPPPPPVPPKNSSKKLLDIGGSLSSPEHSNKSPEKATLDVQDCIVTAMESPTGSVGSACGSLKKEIGSSVISNNNGAQNGGGGITSSVGSNNTSGEKKVKKSKNKEGGAVLIEGVLFRARYLGSTQLVCEGQPTKSTRMMQAEEAVSRIKAPDGDVQPSTEVDLFISTEKIMVLNTDLKEIMMDHALRTISYIADIGDLVVLMARRRFVPQDIDDAPKPNRTPKMICHVFESDEAQFIAQSIGQAFQVAYMEFLKANGIEDHSFVKEMDYQEVLNSQEIFGDELEIFAKKELQKEVVVPKAKGEILGVVIVESGWGSMLPTVVIANLMSTGAAARCGQLNIGDQLIAINGLSLVGLPLSTCQTYIKNTKNQTVVKFTVVPCAPVVEVKIKRPNTKYQLGFSVQNGVICSLLRGGIAERGGVRVGHRIIEINNQSVVAVPHEKIVNLLATSVGEILMKTMPTSMFRLLTGQENPIYI